MYQKTQDRGDYLDRVASHATKGSGRGTVWWNVPEAPKPPEAPEPPKRPIPHDVMLVIAQLNEIRRRERTSKTKVRQARQANILLGTIYKNLGRTFGKIDSGT